MSRLRRLRPHRWTQVSNQAIDELPDPTSIGLLATLLRLPEGYLLPSMDSLAGRWQGVGRRTLYASMRHLVSHGYVVKVRFQVDRGRWSTDTYLFDDPCTDEDLAELAEMFSAGSRIESRRGTERVTDDHRLEKVTEAPADRPATSGRSVRPAETQQKTRSHRPATADRSAADRSVPGRSIEKTPSESSLKTHHHQERDTVAEEEPRTNDEDQAVTLLRSLPEPWRIGDRSMQTLAPLVTSALLAGWRPEELATHLAANPDGVRAPVAVLRARLADLPPPRASRAKTSVVALTEPPEWCGTCGGDHPLAPKNVIFRTDTGFPDGVPCPRCNLTSPTPRPREEPA